ncbi:hypothetical protein M8818_002281 [Zalaria obscura]|uniref:Uncharacterized protein n=1 Tax=Zalaria obscura TaxID=2024903 RepID=A0ACC3SJ98_9PEZI
MAPTPGILYVTMEPKPSLSTAAFHDWYNNEHGPLRLRLPFVQNGFRYRATDLDGPGKGMHEWMAVYDLTDTQDLTRDAYMALRGPPVQSQRERDLRPHVDIDRRTFDLIKSWESQEFRKLEAVQAKQENVLVSVCLKLKEGVSPEELDRWYDEEHVDMLMKVPGWLRTRRFLTSPVDGKSEMEYLALHEYKPENGLGSSDEFEAATSTPWAKQMTGEKAASLRRRVYSLYYTFGPAPRDISVLTSADLKPWDAPAIRTKSVPSRSGGFIESYITTADGAELAYRLEGSPSPDVPVIVLSNAILTHWSIWDEVVAAFLSTPTGSNHRILRYQTRGRTALVGNEPVTIDLLASDLIALLDALRVPRVAAAVGVSLGGATVLKAAIDHPDRIARVLCCDSNSRAPATNKQAWQDRVAMAEKEGMKSASGEAVVGKELAEVTTRRWFADSSYDGAELEKKAQAVADMVAHNSLQGFRKGCQALWEYDFSDKMGSFKGEKGMFLAGREDGVLPKTMKGMAESLGDGKAELVVVDGAGHLPMVERPQEVMKAIEKLLA